MNYLILGTRQTTTAKLSHIALQETGLKHPCFVICGSKNREKEWVSRQCLVINRHELVSNVKVLIIDNVESDNFPSPAQLVGLDCLIVATAFPGKLENPANLLPKFQNVWLSATHGAKKKLDYYHLFVDASRTTIGAFRKIFDNLVSDTDFFPIRPEGMLHALEVSRPGSEETITADTAHQSQVTFNAQANTVSNEPVKNDNNKVENDTSNKPGNNAINKLANITSRKTEKTASNDTNGSGLTNFPGESLEPCVIKKAPETCVIKKALETCVIKKAPETCVTRRALEACATNKTLEMLRTKRIPEMNDMPTETLVTNKVNECQTPESGRNVNGNVLDVDIMHKVPEHDVHKTIEQWLTFRVTKDVSPELVLVDIQKFLAQDLVRPMFFYASYDRDDETRDLHFYLQLKRDHEILFSGLVMQMMRELKSRNKLDRVAVIL